MMQALDWKDSPAGTPGSDEIRVISSLSENDRVNAFLDMLTDKYDVPFKTATQLHVAMDEIFSNICKFAYDGAEGEVRIGAAVREDHLILTIADAGIPYDPLQHTDPDTTLSADEREIGGLGILIVKKIMDEVSYAYTDGMNILTLKKKIK